MSAGGGQTEGAGPPLFQVLVEPDPLGLAVVRGDPAVATFNTTGLRLVFKVRHSMPRGCLPSPPQPLKAEALWRLLPWLRLAFSCCDSSSVC